MNRKFNICTGLKYIFAACLLSCALVSGAHASVSSIIIDAETGDVLVVVKRRLAALSGIAHQADDVVHHL